MKPSEEEAYLHELITDFPLSNPLSASAAMTTLNKRYNDIHNNRENFVERLRASNTNEFVSKFERWPLRFHKHLYQGILSNAGQYRQVNEKNSGAVYFGRDSRFMGSVPRLIHQELSENCRLLVKDAADPIRNGAQFYQRFGQIHPFYDANGRIARLMSSIYFAYHGLSVDWDHLRRNKRWIKRLNDCHKRYGEHNYGRYLEYLRSHWKKSITIMLANIRPIMSYDMSDAYGIMRQLRGHHTLDSFKETFDAQKQSGYELFGAFDGMKLVGLIGMRPVLTLARGFFLHVDDLIVDETERGNGWGEQLMQFAADYAKEKGMVKIFLDARPEAIPFYEKLGYMPHTSPSMSIIV